jgi:hypothetical protein
MKQQDLLTVSTAIAASLSASWVKPNKVITNSQVAHLSGTAVVIATMIVSMVENTLGLIERSEVISNATAATTVANAAIDAVENLNV